MKGWTWGRRRLGICLGGLAALSGSGCGSGPRVEVVAPRWQAVRRTVVETARTELVRTWRLGLDVGARVGPVEREPGDPVAAGVELVPVDRTPLVAAVEAGRARILDLEAQLARARDVSLEEAALESARAEVAAFHEALSASAQQVEAERVRSERRSADLARDDALVAQKALAPAERDRTRLAADTARIDFARQKLDHASMVSLGVAVDLLPRVVDLWTARGRHDRAALEARIEAEKAGLAQAQHALGLARVVSPVDGVVLERLHRGEAWVEAGTRLLVVGRPADLGVVAEVLTEDAVRLEIEDAVELAVAGGSGPRFRARVARIEPQAFLKRSALGVEEARVRVHLGFEPGAGPSGTGVGVGFRMLARFVVEAKDRALAIPRRALLPGKEAGFRVQVVSGGRIEDRRVEVGILGEAEVEIVSGLAESDRVVASGSVDLVPGTEVEIESVANTP